MILKALPIIAVLAFASCNKQTFQCTVVTNTGIGAGVEITTERKFRGTYDEMLAFEIANTTDTKTTTCH